MKCPACNSTWNSQKELSRCPFCQAVLPVEIPGLSEPKSPDEKYRAERRAKNLAVSTSVVTGRVTDMTGDKGFIENECYSDSRYNKYPVRERTFVVLKKWTQFVRKYIHNVNADKEPRIYKQNMYLIAYIDRECDVNSREFERIAKEQGKSILANLPFEYDIVEVESAVRTGITSRYDEYIDAAEEELSTRIFSSDYSIVQVEPGAYASGAVSQVVPPEVSAMLLVRAGLKYGLLANDADKWHYCAISQTSGGWKYRPYGSSYGDTNGIAITGVEGSPRTLEIPSHLDGKKVVALDFGETFERKSTAKVIIPGSVKYILKSCFWGWKNLKSVEAGEGLTAIGRNAFMYCEKLNQISLPASVSMIDREAFAAIDERAKFEVSNGTYAHMYVNMLGYRTKVRG